MLLAITPNHACVHLIVYERRMRETVIADGCRYYGRTVQACTAIMGIMVVLYELNYE